MFETHFSYKSATPLPSAVSLKDALSILHDFETVNKLNPDVRGSKPIVPKSTSKHPVAPSAKSIRGDTPLGETQYFEVEDDLPFIPKRLWSGGVRYQADYVPTEQGCNITVHAPGGFTSVNYWRLVHDETGAVVGSKEEQDDNTELAPVKSRDLMHTEFDSGAWHVQITSDARCNMTFATFVKSFLKNSHVQLQQAFIDKCMEMKDNTPTTRSRRPTIAWSNPYPHVIRIRRRLTSQAASTQVDYLTNICASEQHVMIIARPHGSNRFEYQRHATIHLHQPGDALLTSNMELKFVNGRLHVGYRRDAAIEVFYCGQRVPSAARLQYRRFGERTTTSTEALGAIDLECILPDGTIEKIRPGEVAWIPFFNHEYIAGDSNVEKQEIRDSRLQLLHAYLSSTGPARLLAFEDQLRKPSNGPYRMVLLDIAARWRLDASQASNTAQAGGGLSRRVILPPRPALQSTASSTFSTVRPVLKPTTTAHHKESMIIDLTDTPKTSVEPSGGVPDFQDDISSVFGTTNHSPPDTAIRSPTTRIWNDQLRVRDLDNTCVKRRSTAESMLLPRKRPRIPQQTQTIATGASAFDIPPDTTAVSSRAGGGRRFTIEVPDFESSPESEVDNDENVRKHAFKVRRL